MSPAPVRTPAEGAGHRRSPSRDARVAIVGPTHPYKGGASHHTTHLAHRASAAGYDVVLESWRAQYPALLYPGRLTVDEPEMPLFDPTRRRLSWRRPDGWLREGRRIGRWADIVVLQFHSSVQVVPYLGLLRGLRGTGARTVLIANNVVPHERRAVDVRGVRALLGRVDLVVVHDEAQAQIARSLAGTPVRVATLPPHLPGPVEVDTPADPVLHDRLLMFGMIRRYKGLDVLLRALHGATHRPRLIVAGEFWGGIDAMRSLVDELALADRVELRPGYVAAGDIPGLFAGSDALVLPYRSATGSQNTELAFRYGKPVIVTRTGALADAVTDGVDGVVCAPDDIDDLARAVDRFYAPGEALRLRGNLTSRDDSATWKLYLEALLTPTGTE